ncbi:hypothetical protein PV325_003400 [Microctonus aethiopoides]|nr:hypothetical protein PV325_003400 [Microctonus aethiopoides]
MEVQQQHSPVCVGPLDFSRRGVAEASAFRVVKPKQPPSSFVNQQPHTNETNNNENIQEHTRIPIETRGCNVRLMFPRLWAPFNNTTDVTSLPSSLRKNHTEKIKQQLPCYSNRFTFPEKQKLLTNHMNIDSQYFIERHC